MTIMPTLVTLEEVVVVNLRLVIIVVVVVVVVTKPTTTLLLPTTTTTTTKIHVPSRWRRSYSTQEDLSSYMRCARPQQVRVVTGRAFVSVEMPRHGPGSQT